MVKRLISIVGCFLLFFCLLSCDKEEKTVIEYPSQPKGYQELLTVYQSQDKYLDIDFSSSTTITFESRTVVIPSDGMKIHDCRTTSPSVISLSEENNMWLINGTLSGIKYHKTLTDEQATIVYAYVDKDTLHMYLSNGSKLDFPYNEKPKAREFTMPIVRITCSQSITKDDYVPGSVVIEDPDGTFSEVKDFRSSASFKGHGNSTWSMPKKPYKIKLDQKSEVLGMPSNKNWVVLANYADKSLMRNNTGMEISRRLGFKWTPRSVDVDLYLNGSYQGVYTLFEAKKVGKNRVNIGDDDYYLEIESAFDEPYNFITDKRVPIQFKQPEEPTSEQFDYIKNYFKEFETVLFGENFKDENEGYAKYIDIPSFINNFICQELSKNIDGNLRKSSFLTLEEGGKLEFYHQWDFDLAFGNANYFPTTNGPTGWWVKNHDSASNINAGWYYRLFQDPNFVQKVKDRWNEVYPELQTIPQYIDITVEEMGLNPAKNFRKWDILDTWVWPNVKVTGSYELEVQYLESFYTERLEWMNKNINAL